MTKRFQFPTVSRRKASLILSVLVLAFGAAYLLTYPKCCAPTPVETPATVAVQTFRNTCVKEARHANGGGDLVMDDETERKIGDYCGCVADGILAKTSPLELAKIGEGTQSDDTMKVLDAVVADCQAKLH